MEWIRNLNHSHEAVDYQFDNQFFVQLSKVIGKARELDSKKLTNSAPEVKAIGDLISSFLGTHVECRIFNTKACNAWVQLPDYNKNHPFFAMWQDFASSKDGLKALKGKTYDIGNVNRATGKISGVYSKCATPITLTKGIMESTKFTNEEIAAIVLHEMGHIFSFFETMYYTAGTNLAIMSAMEDCIGVKDPAIKAKVIKGLIDEKIIEPTIDENAIAQIENENLPTVIITSGYRKIRQDGNAVCYNRTAWEQSADQFAVRMGAGTHLASGLNKIVPADDAKRNFMLNSIWSYVYTTLFGFLMWWIGSVGTGGAMVVCLYLFFLYGIFFQLGSILEVTHNTYDQTKDRVARIRREQIGKLKMLDKDDPLYIATVNQIDEIEKIENQQTNIRSGLDAYKYAFFYNLFTNQLTKKEQQQIVEKLMNNELYVTAAKIRLQGK